MSRQMIYFAGALLLMMATALAVSAEAIPALNATVNNTTLNNTTFNNTTMNLSINETINATPVLVNVTINETLPATDIESNNMSTNETMPSGNETYIPPVETAPVETAPVETAPVNDIAPVENEIIPPVTDTTRLVTDTPVLTDQIAPTIVPAAGILGKMEAGQVQTSMLGLAGKPTFVIGSGLSAGEVIQVGSTKAQTTHVLGSAAKSTVEL